MFETQTQEKLQSMKLHGMLQALEEQKGQTNIRDLTFEERFALLIEQEWLVRENRKMARLLHQARFRERQACLEDLDYQTPRNLDKKLIRQMATCSWIDQHLNLLVTGPTGIGKTYLACALGHQACRKGYRVTYARVSRLFEELTLAKGDGSYHKELAKIARAHLLIMDDWGLAPLNPSQHHDFLEILEDRYDLHSTLLVSQLPIDKWHAYINDPTLADAILDRIVHNAYKVNLNGKDSMRKKKKPLDPNRPQDHK